MMVVVCGAIESYETKMGEREGKEIERKGIWKEIPR
jgi:hypothetical protein